MVNKWQVYTESTLEEHATRLFDDFPYFLSHLWHTVAYMVGTGALLIPLVLVFATP